MNREKIYQGVFDYLKNAVDDTDILWSRSLRHWTDVPSEQQPAVFVPQGSETPGKNGVMACWLLDSEIYVYCNAGNNPDTIPATEMNSILDKINQALRPRRQLGECCQTLGGLVIDCKISGKVETDAGTLGPQSVAIIPIRIIVEDEE